MLVVSVQTEDTNIPQLKITRHPQGGTVPIGMRHYSVLSENLRIEFLLEIIYDFLSFHVELTQNLRLEDMGKV